MTEWWGSLSGLQKIFAFIAIPSTLILIIQSVLLLFGIGDSDGDSDDGIADTNGDGVSLFTIRGIVAMFCVGGWSGIVLLQSGVNQAVSIVLSTLFGLIALIGIAFLIKVLMKLQSSGNVKLGNAIGKIGQVYIPIPARGKGNGKVNITIQDRYTEVDAITNEDDIIQTGEMVRVISTDEVGLLLVQKINK